MKEFQLNRVNETWRDLSIVMIMPLWFGALALSYAWDYLFWRILGLGLVGVSSLIIGIYYLKIRADVYIVKVDNNTLSMQNKKTRRIEGRYYLGDIAVLIHDRSMNQLSNLIINQSPKERIHICSSKGKVLFVCSNAQNPADFYLFLSAMRQSINNTRGDILYSKIIRGVSTQRIAYVNPSFENSRAVRRLLRQNNFYYPIIVFIIVVVVIIILINILNS